MHCAFMRGAERVIIIDRAQYRLDRAKEVQKLALWQDAGHISAACAAARAADSGNAWAAVPLCCKLRAEYGTAIAVQSRRCLCCLEHT
jgi:threonine dehydrogenase-like Zn-dependent dehydrogenase